MCVVGQLRTAARPKLARNLRSAWNRIGQGCVDIFLQVGIEPQIAASGHSAQPAASVENASVAAAALRPLEWRVTSYSWAQPWANCTMDEAEPRADSAVVCHKRPWDEVTAGGRMCNVKQCTHCSASVYYAQADRIAACAEMAITAQRRLARPYRWFVFHRPDIWLYGIPRYVAWASPGAGGLQEGAAHFCNGNGNFVSDFFGLVAWPRASLVARLGEHYRRCQSKRANGALGCRTETGWPSWHYSECILRTAFVRHGMEAKALEGPMWEGVRRSCRIVREPRAPS